MAIIRYYDRWIWSVGAFGLEFDLRFDGDTVEKTRRKRKRKRIELEIKDRDWESKRARECWGEGTWNRCGLVKEEK